MEQNTHKKISYGLVIASFIIFLLYILLNCILDFSGGQGLLLFLIFLYTEIPIAIGFVVHSCWYCFKFEKLITAWYIYNQSYNYYMAVNFRKIGIINWILKMYRC